MKQTKQTLIIFSIATAILLLPLVSSFFSNEIKWSPSDYGIAAILLFSCALVVDLILRWVTSKRLRFILVATALFLLLMIWAELAVGLFGSPFAGS